MATFLFLGTGSSAGIPMIGCSCSVCISDDPRNRRLRPSGLLNVGGKVVLIDAGPDFRRQALCHRLHHLDGVLLTHSHFDHVAGLDELRVYYLLKRQPLPVLMSTGTLEDLKKRCEYLFRARSRGISLAAQLDVHLLEGERGETEFVGLSIRHMTYEQGGMPVTGYRVGSFAYVSDIRTYPETIFDDLAGVEILVLSALRTEPSVMHFNLGEAVAFAQQVGARHTYFTHIGHEVEHVRTSETLPKGVYLAYDGLHVEFAYGS